MSQTLRGLRCIILLAWLCSSNRRRFPLRLVLTGLIAQLLLAAGFLKVPLLQDALVWANRLVLTLEVGFEFSVDMVGRGFALLGQLINQGRVVLLYKLVK